ncbi:hypothetical protein T261_8319 [Streptomyces lydicus]|nr:hypothetical protein T261_8319 [Streptomyces lydicus]
MAKAKAPAVKAELHKDLAGATRALNACRSGDEKSFDNVLWERRLERLRHAPRLPRNGLYATVLTPAEGQGGPQASTPLRRIWPRWTLSSRCLVACVRCSWCNQMASFMGDETANAVGRGECRCLSPSA